MKKVYCYVEVPDECETLNDAFASWLEQTIHRMKVGLHPQIEFYQMEDDQDSEGTQ